MKLVAILLVFGFSSSVLWAENDRNTKYLDVKIKNRVKHGYSNDGTIIYQSIDIKKYSDELKPEELGVMTVEDKRVREIYSRVNVKTAGIRSKKEELNIGTIEIKKGVSVREINHGVSVTGDINVRGGGQPKQLKIGGVTVKSDGAIKEINTSTSIRGNIRVN
jgi:hypothetical protein